MRKLTTTKPSTPARCAGCVLLCEPNAPESNNHTSIGSAGNLRERGGFSRDDS